MRDKTIDFMAQAGGGVRAICDAITKDKRPALIAELKNGGDHEEQA